MIKSTVELEKYINRKLNNSIDKFTIVESKNPTAYINISVKGGIQTLQTQLAFPLSKNLLNRMLDKLLEVNIEHLKRCIFNVEIDKNQIYEK